MIPKLEHIEAPRAECPACVAHDALVQEAITAARAQIASTDPTDGHVAADRLARLLLAVLGIDP